jgi:hypothetical protein
MYLSLNLFLLLSAADDRSNVLLQVCLKTFAYVLRILVLIEAGKELYPHYL